MSSQINITNTPRKPFQSFRNAPKVKKGFTNYRYHNRDVVETHTKVKALAGSLAGVGISMAIFAKNQKLDLKNPLNYLKVKYGIKEMIVMSGLGVIGGVLGGVIGSDKKKEKVDEGVFQFMNATVPLLAVHPATKLMDKSSKFNTNLPLRVGVILAVLLAGMKGAAEISNFINDPKDKVPDRKLTLKDALANTDDALGAFAVAKIPFVDKLEKLLPLIYTWCGYRAGQSN